MRAFIIILSLFTAGCVTPINQINPTPYENESNLTCFQIDFYSDKADRELEEYTKVHQAKQFSQYSGIFLMLGSILLYSNLENTIMNAEDMDEAARDLAPLRIVSPLLLVSGGISAIQSDNGTLDEIAELKGEKLYYDDLSERQCET